jgi:hypothetical protein
MSSTICHAIASRSATALIKDADAAGLKWSEMAVAIESALTIEVAAIVEMSGVPDKLRMATEMMDQITQHAHSRVSCYLRGVPYNGE